MPKTVTAKQYNAKFKKLAKGWTEVMQEHNDDALTIGGPGELYWYSAIVGIGRQHGSDMLFVYDYDKLVDAKYNYYRAVDGLDDQAAYERACEWVDYNITDAYVGKGTPIILYGNFSDLDIS